VIAVSDLLKQYFVRNMNGIEIRSNFPDGLLEEHDFLEKIKTGDEIWIWQYDPK
jgi:hypothetical protein